MQSPPTSSSAAIPSKCALRPILARERGWDNCKGIPLPTSYSVLHFHTYQGFLRQLGKIHCFCMRRSSFPPNSALGRRISCTTSIQGPGYTVGPKCLRNSCQRCRLCSISPSLDLGGPICKAGAAPQGRAGQRQACTPWPSRLISLSYAARLGGSWPPAPRR